MFNKTITLFKMFGFAVRVDLSWLIILGLVVWSLAGGVFPADYKGLDWNVYLLMGLGGALGLFASIVFHELCHSLVARRYGLQIKGITLFLFGGVAEMGEEPKSAKVEFFMAVAGPISSLLLAGIFMGLGAAGREWSPLVSAVFHWIGIINLFLAGFNMIPGFPLDGGRVLRSILWQFRGNLRWATMVASRVGGVFGMALMGLGFISILTGNAIGGLWYILIGMFLRGAAKQGYQQVLIRQALEGEHVRRFMNPQPVTVPPSLTLAGMVDDYVYRYHFKMFPVVDDGRLAGCVTTRQIKEIPQEEWAFRTVADVVEGCSGENTIAADADAMKALALMQKNQASRLMVVEDGRLVGIISLKDLLKFLSLKMELEAEPRRGPRPPDDTLPVL